MDSRLQELQREYDRRMALQKSLMASKLPFAPNTRPSDPSAPSSPSWLGDAKNLGKALLSGIPDIGKNIANLPYHMAQLGEMTPGSDQSLGSTLGMTSENVPHMKDYDYMSMLGVPKTLPNELAASIPQIPFYAGTPEMGAGKVAEAAPFIEKALKGAGGMIGRGAPQVGTAAALSDNPSQGVGDMAIMQGISEALPLPFKAMGALSEHINPQKYATKLAGVIKDSYQSAKAKAKELYDPIFAKHGDKNIYQTDQPQIGKIGLRLIGDSDGRSPDLIGKTFGLDEDTIRSKLGDKSYSMYQLFKNNPTFDNAKKLRSTMGERLGEVMGYAPSDYASTLKKTLNYARSAITDDMGHYLDRTDPGAFHDWNAANDYFKNQVAPFRDKSIYPYAKGEKSYASPAVLRNSLRNALDKRDDFDKVRISRDHVLNDIHDDLQHKIDSSELTSKVVDFLAGELAHPKFGVGGMAAMMLHPSSAVGKLLSNPIVNKWAGKVGDVYNKNRKAAISTFFPTMEGYQNVP